MAPATEWGSAAVGSAGVVTVALFGEGDRRDAGLHVLWVAPFRVDAEPDLSGEGVLVFGSRDRDAGEAAWHGAATVKMAKDAVAKVVCAAMGFGDDDRGGVAVTAAYPGNVASVREDGPASALSSGTKRDGRAARVTVGLTAAAQARVKRARASKHATARFFPEKSFGERLSEMECKLRDTILTLGTTVKKLDTTREELDTTVKKLDTTEKKLDTTRDLLDTVCELSVSVVKRAAIERAVEAVQVRVWREATPVARSEVAALVTRNASRQDWRRYADSASGNAGLAVDVQRAGRGGAARFAPLVDHPLPWKTFVDAWDVAWPGWRERFADGDGSAAVLALAKGRRPDGAEGCEYGRHSDAVHHASNSSLRDFVARGGMVGPEAAAVLSTLAMHDEMRALLAPPARGAIAG